MRLLWSNVRAVIFVYCFSDLRAVMFISVNKIENENNNMKILTAEAQCIGLEFLGFSL